MFTVIIELYYLNSEVPVWMQGLPLHIKYSSMSETNIFFLKLADLCSFPKICKNYENLPLQYVQRFFSAVKIENLIGKISVF